MLAAKVQRHLGLDYAFANSLEARSPAFTQKHFAGSTYGERALTCRPTQLVFAVVLSPCGGSCFDDDQPTSKGRL